MSGHDAARERLGSLALGVLEPEEAAAVRAHAAGCATCAPELAELESTARLLALADPDHVEAVPRALAPPPVAPVLHRIEAERRARRGRRRRARLGSALAAVALLLAALVIVLGDDDPGARDVRLASTLPGVTASARVAPAEPGTRIELRVEGLAPAETLLVWLERPDGRRVPAGPVRAGPDRAVRATLQARLPAGEAAAVGLSQRDGTDVLRAELG